MISIDFTNENNDLMVIVSNPSFTSRNTVGYLKYCERCGDSKYEKWLSSKSDKQPGHKNHILQRMVIQQNKGSDIRNRYISWYILKMSHLRMVHKWWTIGTEMRKYIFFHDIFNLETLLLLKLCWYLENIYNFRNFMFGIT